MGAEPALGLGDEADNNWIFWEGKLRWLGNLEEEGMEMSGET